MKSLLFLAASVMMFSFAHLTTLKVDTSSSNINWVGYKVTGKHSGTVKLSDGTLSMDHGKLVGGSFNIDMNTIACTDMQGEYADKLVGHLKADDFFGVATYPKAAFVITRAIPQGTAGAYKIVGNLTIKDVTKEVKFFAQTKEENGTFSATGKITVDRSEFNIKYGSGSFFDGLGDKTIYDEFDLEVTLVAR